MRHVSERTPTGEAERELEFDLRSILGLLRRQLRLIAVTVVIVVAIAGGVTFTLQKVYTASALVLVDPSRKDLFNPDQQTHVTSADSARVDSEVELARAETTVRQVVSDLDLVRHPLFMPKPGVWDTLRALVRLPAPPSPSSEELLKGVVDKLRSTISVQRRGLTFLINFEAKSTDRELAATLANALAEAYIYEQIQAKQAGIASQRAIIQAQVQQERLNVENSERAFDEFVDGNLQEIVRLTGRTDIAELSRALVATDNDRSRMASVAALADNSLARRDWQALTSQLQNDALAQYDARRTELETALSGAVNSPQNAADLRAELSEIEDQMTSAAQAELTTLREQVTLSEVRAADLRTQRNSSVLQSSLPASMLAQILGIQQNADNSRRQFQTLLSRLDELSAQAGLQVPDSRIASPAVPPLDHSFPNTRLILVLGALAALGLGVGLAFLVENFIGGFTSEEQLESVLRTDVVATVAKQRGKSGEAVVSGMVADAPLSIFAESIRRARLGIDQAMRRARGSHVEGGRVVVVTSAVPNEGKTTLALSLARAYALSGHSTLLIDCDLRKPGIHRHLQVEPSSGLLEYLASGDAPPPLQSIMSVDPESGAQVILGSRRSDMPTDQLLAGATFARLIRAAERSFDIVILDTSPIEPVVDGLYLAQYADVIMMVVRWASTPQRDVRSTLLALAEAKRPETEIVTVLNQQAGSGHAYRNKYAGYYAEA